ncbi:MAG TPA: hypothetical protein VME22_02065 [Solirubrobacteraceae bacterium]|nr:hypothetical protein [Solirubrobacteraceae bacterium]
MSAQENRSRMDSELLLVGSIPLSTAEEVFGACRQIAPFLGSVPDGEVGARRFWTPYLPFMTFSRHPDLIEVHHPSWAEFLEDGRWELPTDGDFSEHWPFKIKPGVTELDLGDLHYAGPALESYRVFRELRDRGALPAGIAFQVGIPSTDGVVEDYFPERADWPMAKRAYEASAFREIERMLTEIPPEDLVVQWDLAVEPVNIEMVVNPWLSEAADSSGHKPPDGVASPSEGEDVPKTADELFAHHMRSINELWRGVPEPVRLGYHWCYGTWGGWPMTELRSLDLCVRLTNAVVAGAERRVDYVHMPVIRDPDEAFFAPLENLEVGDTRVYLGLIHHDDPDPDGLDRRLELARRYLKEFGIAGVCGYGRVRHTEIDAIFDSHRRGAERLRALSAAAS